MKYETLLENYSLPGQPETGIGRFVEYFNRERYHASLNNLTSADVHYGRGTNVLHMRRKITQRTMNERQWLHRQDKVARKKPDEPVTRLNPGTFCPKGFDDE